MALGDHPMQLSLVSMPSHISPAPQPTSLAQAGDRPGHIPGYILGGLPFQLNITT